MPYDGTGADKLEALKKWWDVLLEKGPAYGYFPKPSKTWLIVKDKKLEEAKLTFKKSGVKITSEGMRHLGSNWKQLVQRQLCQREDRAMDRQC